MEDVVYEAVESSEDAALTARFAQSNATARYGRIKLWDKLPAELATMKGEVGRRGAQVPERSGQPGRTGRHSPQTYVQAGLPAHHGQDRKGGEAAAGDERLQNVRRGGRTPCFADVRRLR